MCEQSGSGGELRQRAAVNSSLSQAEMTAWRKKLCSRRLKETLPFRVPDMSPVPAKSLLSYVNNLFSAGGWAILSRGGREGGNWATPAHKPSATCHSVIYTPLHKSCSKHKKMNEERKQMYHYTGYLAIISSARRFRNHSIAKGHG